MSYSITLTDSNDPAIRNAIVGPLVAFNTHQTGVDDFRPLALALSDDSGQTVGGLWGRTAFGWLFVELLFVPESLRGQGLGRELLHQAEAEAIPAAATAPGSTRSSSRRAASTSASDTPASAS
jgi:GNAT superfamily N-acetyltransferase